MAALDKFFGVSFQCQPVIAEFEGTNVELLALYMVATNPGMELLKNLFSFFRS